MEQFGDLGKSMKVLLELPLRHQKQHDQCDRLVVKRVKIDAFLRAPESTHDIVNEVCRSVREPNAEPNSRAHRGFALFYDSNDGVAMLGLNLACRHQVPNEFI